MEETLRSTRSFEQFVLLSVVELSLADETPAHSYDVTQAAKAHLDDLSRDPFGGVERQEVISALRSLADDGLLEKDQTTSATGKGRPAYVLAVDADVVLDELADAEAVGPYVETLRTEA
ncbi:PadR family transcriptional regulator [Halomicroarcula sp. F13]|uniref:PadR family transcriptional regulator n=1 Tax=Haloarcula rubra TaxID=2487747 RepID=A0AAW4PXG8_9EURY|nr:helix-turn-helix transcriptional regulator [Halomicroarcula rubra]MBX0325713.1 PadR family transcriptional regulator [Halomicroarcula rubra]